MVPTRSLLKLAAAGGLAAMLSTPSLLAAQAGLSPAPRPGSATQVGLKDPATARVLGIIPGLGHLYAGEPKRGALVAGTFVGAILVGVAAAVGDCLANYTEPECDSSPIVDVLVPAAMIGTIGFSIWDAGRAAKRTNFRRRMPGRLTIGGSGDGRRVRVGMTIEL